MVDSVATSETSCQDVDHTSCSAMLTQNPHMCQDAVLSRSVCPKVCNNCPLKCYSCQISSYNISRCNTITCNQHQSCVIQSINGTGFFSLGCDTENFCHKNDEHVLYTGTNSSTCCKTDLCNVPQLPTTAVPPVATTRHILQRPYPECPRDILIFLDQSEPLVSNWTEVKQFLTDIVRTMDIGRKITQTNIALEFFDIRSHAGWSFRRNNHNNSELLQQIKTFSPKAPDNTSHGNFEAAVDDLHDSQHINNRKRFGNRGGIQDVVLFITGSSGTSNPIIFMRLPDLRKRYSNIITIGIGNITKKDSVSYIATDSNHAIFLNTTAELLSPSIEHRALSLICSN